MTAADNNWMLVEFEGTYQVAHPDGVKGRKVLKNFHVKVEMNKSFLDATIIEGSFHSLRGPFASFYTGFLKKLYPDMIDLYQFGMIEATELDGGKIRDPKCMNHADLMAYIVDRKYKINIGLYDDQQLRNEVVLYEADRKGQQHLQGHTERVRGGVLSVTNDLKHREHLIQVLPITDHTPKPTKRTVVADNDFKELPQIPLSQANVLPGDMIIPKKEDEVGMDDLFGVQSTETDLERPTV